MFYLGDSDFYVIDNSTVSITDWIISYCGIQVSDRGVSLFYTLPVKTESEISNKEGSSGNATVEFETDLWCLTCDDETKNIKGKAVIVHQGEDDLVSQPSGAAGSRIICGAIIE